MIDEIFRDISSGKVNKYINKILPMFFIAVCWYTDEETNRTWRLKGVTCLREQQELDVLFTVVIGRFKANDWLLFNFINKFNSCRHGNHQVMSKYSATSKL